MMDLIERFPEFIQKWIEWIEDINIRSTVWLNEYGGL